MAQPDQVVLITGASKGFGFAAAQELAARGHHVVATMRHPDRDGEAVRRGHEPRIEVTACDVTDRAGDDTHRVMVLRRRLNDDEFEAMLRGLRNLGFPGSFFAAEEARTRNAPAK